MCENSVCNLEDCVVEYGFCHCNCGRKTNINPQNSTKNKYIKGEPKLYISGHCNRILLPKYIVNEETKCWEWQLGKDTCGYGCIWFNNKSIKAHRYYYELYKGPIPEGLQVDHLCRVRHCVNPEHLEIVTSAENTRRGNSAKITWEIVDKIRYAYNSGGITYKKLGEVYDLSSYTIGEIIRYETWIE